MVDEALAFTAYEVSVAGLRLLGGDLRSIGVNGAPGPPRDIADVQIALTRFRQRLKGRGPAAGWRPYRRPARQW